MADKTNIHDGHRGRLLNTVSNVGLSGLSEVQAMEFILFYVIPRGDVNPLAHRLLKKFKKVSNVLDASVEDLIDVCGISTTSAKKLKALVEIFNYYTASKVKHGEGLNTFGDIYGYAESLLRYKNTEELYVFGFNNKGDFVADRCLAKGNLNMVGIDMREISNFVSSFKVPMVYIAHNHPGGSCVASYQDMVSHIELVKKFEFSGSTLVDNIIVGDDGIYSVKDKSMKRFFGAHSHFNDLVGQLSKPNDE